MQAATEQRRARHRRGARGVRPQHRRAHGRGARAAVRQARAAALRHRLPRPPGADRRARRRPPARPAGAAALRPRLRPVLVGVDGGADAILEEGFKPDMIVGDMDSATERDAALRRRARRARLPRRPAPGREHLEALGLPHKVVPAPGTSQDVAMLIAAEKGAELIVSVGSQFNLVEFLDKNRRGMSSTFLTRLRIGEILVDAKGVCRLYRPRPGARRSLLVLAGAGCSRLSRSSSLTPGAQRRRRPAVAQAPGAARARRSPRRCSTSATTPSRSSPSSWRCRSACCSASRSATRAWSRAPSASSRRAARATCASARDGRPTLRGRARRRASASRATPIPPLVGGRLAGQRVGARLPRRRRRRCAPRPRRARAHRRDAWLGRRRRASRRDLAAISPGARRHARRAARGDATARPAARRAQGSARGGAAARSGAASARELQRRARRRRADRRARRRAQPRAASDAATRFEDGLSSTALRRRRRAARRRRADRHRPVADRLVPGPRALRASTTSTSSPGVPRSSSRWPAPTAPTARRAPPRLLPTRAAPAARGSRPPCPRAAVPLALRRRRPIAPRCCLRRACRAGRHCARDCAALRRSRPGVAVALAAASSRSRAAARCARAARPTCRRAAGPSSGALAGLRRSASRSSACVDDLLDAATARLARPRRGRARAAAFSTGALKAVGSLGLALLVLADRGCDDGEYLLAVALLVLTTNLFNLLDLRPGRSVKAFVLLGAALTLGDAGRSSRCGPSACSPAPVLVARRLRPARAAMLGDTGVEPDRRARRPLARARRSTPPARPSPLAILLAIAPSTGNSARSPR